MEPFIHESARVAGCTLADGAKIYQQCRVDNTVIGRNTTVADFSHLGDCELGDGVILQRNAMMYGVKFGDHSYTGKNFTAWHCEVGKFCSVSWNVSIGGANHDYSRVTTHSFLYSDEFGLKPEDEPGYDRFAEPCVVGNDVWIAANVCICRGVRIGDGAVIGAGAVVTKDVEPYTIVAGVPARVVRRRFDDRTAALLQESRWWDFPDSVIRENFALFNAQADGMVAEKMLELRRKLDEQGGQTP